MAEIRAFAGLRYARELEPRLAPPYDVLDAQARAELAREPENLVALTLPRDASGEVDYAGAGARLREWVRSGVLVAEDQPALYVLEERLEDGRVRRGLLAAVRLAEYGAGEILPHERTMAGPKEDRLRLTREVQANLEPLFFLYEDREQQLGASLEKAVGADALATARAPSGAQIVLGALRDPALIDSVRSFLRERPLVIADGHHRYETMLHYRDERRAQSPGREDPPYDFVLAYVVNAFDPGSRIQAIHRVLSGELRDVPAALGEAGFELQPLAEVQADAVLELLASRAAERHAFVLATPGGGGWLATRTRGEALDVEVLHEELLPRLGGELSFDAQPARLLSRLRERRAALGILMHPIDPDAFFRTVQQGRVLPQKSTFFSPKVPGGLVFRDLA